MSLLDGLRPREVHHRLVQGSSEGVLKASFGDKRQAEQAWAMLAGQKARQPDIHLENMWHLTRGAVTGWCIIELDGPEPPKSDEWGEISF